MPLSKEDLYECGISAIIQGGFNAAKVPVSKEDIIGIAQVLKSKKDVHYCQRQRIQGTINKMGAY